MNIPFADAATQNTLTDAQAKYFHEKGFLVVKNVVKLDELQQLQQDTLALIQQRNTGPDFWYNDDIPSDWYNNYKEGGNKEVKKDGFESTNDDSTGQDRKKGVPFRIEYVADKLDTCKYLLAHPFLLKAIAKIQGPDFLPTWDSLVFKYEGDGVPIKWHRDASAESIGCGFYNYGSAKTKKGTYPPPIDAGIYLDSANAKLGNCLWAIPGSHFWDDQVASSMISHFTANGFRTAGAVPIEVEPGDVIMHNILLLHGSSSCNSPLRRTVYYEFRPSEAELSLGPHIPEYVPLKKRMLAECIKRRKSHFPEEQAFEYDDTNNPPHPSRETLTQFRFAHDDYFAKSYKG